MLPEQQQRILGYFIEEAKDHLNTIQQGLLSLQNTIDDPEMVKEVFRAAHSVKGGAAMLGIHSIQKTSHRLEDYFKELEERPIQVDRKLENLFLRVFDTLQTLLEHLQGPFGLTDDVAESVMSGVDPVFEELKQHLERLANSPSKDTVVPPKPSESDRELLLKTFKQDVMEVLRQMLQLFKPPSWPDSRPQLQECCSRLIELGERFNLPAWINLVQMTENAIANPDNSSQTLAPIIIKEIKAAQELVLAGRPNDISIGEQLLELQPALVQAEPDLEISDDVEDLFSIASEQESTLFSEEQTEISESLSFSSSDDDYNFEASSADLWETNTDKQLTPNTALTNFDLSQTPHPVRAADPSGPEVGAAELNNLADLFETLEVDATWQEEETLNDAAVEPAPDLLGELDADAENEFADLFEDVSQEPVRGASSQFDDDFSLFDESIFDEEESSPQPVAYDLDIGDGEDEFADLFEEASEKPAPTQDPLSLFDEAMATPGEDDDFSLFEEPFTDSSTHESVAAEDFNFNVSDSELHSSAHASPDKSDNLSELFAGLEEDDLNWEEAEGEDIAFEAETLPDRISDDLSTFSSGWDEDWATADDDITNLEASQDLSPEFQSFEYEEQDLEFQISDLELPIEEDKVEPQISNLESEINSDSDLLGVDETDITWADETDSEEIPDLAAFTDDFDSSDLFA